MLTSFLLPRKTSEEIKIYFAHMEPGSPHSMTQPRKGPGVDGGEREEEGSPAKPGLAWSQAL